ncbi:efflux RND transporter periplasmic adaptor subunit [Mariprofundus erugo]|uniref:Efflux RND transporter periplasmic adaptor subunit n=2 Tax=Mariprofundus erugo TaxID=2528639 RepID=A0A5R9GXH7_9PROT|nr:efflux RND transporter periplasmic adaptor subunit [Mariprofundus erugo]
MATMPALTQPSPLKRLHRLHMLSLCLLPLLTACDNHDTAHKQTEPRPVIVMKAHTQPVSDTIEALGTAQARESVTITASVAGRLDEISFTDGQAVHKGDVIARMDQDEDKAQLTAAIAQLSEHQREIKRLQALLARKAAATRDLDERKTLAAVTASNIAQIRARMSELTLTAPFDGRLGIRRVSPGALIQPGTVITTLDASDAIDIDFSIPSTRLHGLQVGDHIQATTDARPGEIFNGKLSVIDSRIDPITRSILLRSRIDNHQGLLIPGMLMRVTLTTAPHEALVVPEECITQKQGEHFITLVTSDGKAEIRPVQTGLRHHGMVEISQGLKSGEQVVVRGMGFVKAGKPVTISTTWTDIDHSNEPLADEAR